MLIPEWLSGTINGNTEVACYFCVVKYFCCSLTSDELHPLHSIARTLSPPRRESFRPRRRASAHVTLHEYHRHDFAIARKF
jgi:hypothetical protein